LSTSPPSCSPPRFPSTSRKEQAGFTYVALLIALAALCLAPAHEASAFGEVAEILRARCVACHQGEAAPLGLRLDSHAGVLRGSSRGAVVRPGEPAASELLRRVRGESLPRMPLTGPPWLAEREMAVIERWIAAGAPPGERTAPAKKERRPTDAVTYADVAPVLIGRCAKCHSANGLMGPPPEGYRLDSFQATLDASERARAVPGNPAASELVRRIRGQARPRMPLDGPPYLAEDEMRLIEQWIAQGARDAQGERAAIPAGARVRLHGMLVRNGVLDGLRFRARGERRAEPGDYVELRGTIEADGSVRAERVRRR
jgi:uncharacterized membrane protein